MTMVLLRECRALLMGILAAILAGAVAAVSPFWLGLLVLVITASAVCAWRHESLKHPFRPITQLRLLGWEATKTIGTVSILLFEVGLGLVVVINDVPIRWWLVVCCLGANYLVFYALAHWLGEPTARTVDCEDEPRQRVQPDECIGVPLVLVLGGAFFFAASTYLIVVGQLIDEGGFMFGYFLFYSLAGFLSLTLFTAHLVYGRPSRQKAGIATLGISICLTAVAVAVRELVFALSH